MCSYCCEFTGSCSFNVVYSVFYNYCPIPFGIFRSYHTLYNHTNVCNLYKNLLWSKQEYCYLFSGNVAYNKPTEQTGVWQGHISERAVDGNNDTNQDHGSCAHPDDPNRSPAWWRVDLEALHRIHSVTIYNTNNYIGELAM